MFELWPVEDNSECHDFSEMQLWLIAGLACAGNLLLFFLVVFAR
jgi:hypothetical protein